MAEQPERQAQPERPERKQEQRVYQREVDGPEPPPEEEAEEEPWHTVVARAVVAHLSPGEPEVMAGYLFKCPIGGCTCTC